MIEAAPDDINTFKYLFPVNDKRGRQPDLIAVSRFGQQTFFQHGKTKLPGCFRIGMIASKWK